MATDSSPPAGSADPVASALTEIMLAVFRVNGRLLEQGDRLVAPLALTSARWQVLGAVALAGEPLSAPQIAEAMGVTRQGAQKQLNALEAAGMFARHPNPRHRRSPLYALTDLGQRTFTEAMALQQGWATRLSDGLQMQELQATLRLLDRLYERLGRQGDTP